MTTSDTHAEFAPDWDQPVRYIERTHRWYTTLGYDTPYRYAHYLEVPFTPLPAPLSELRVALLTTAAPYRAEYGDQSVRAPYNAKAKFFEVYSGASEQDHDVRISHVGIDRNNLQDDPNLWFPLPALRRARDRGRIGALTPHFHGVPTNRSQRHTLEIDLPEVLSRLRAEGAQAAVLVANCPICHQTLSLAARHLEAHGISTVVMGCARDIVEHVGVPRLLFSDFPLGAACGRPFDAESQASTLELALRVLETAPGPRTTVQNPLRWPGPPDWRLGFMNADRLTAADIAERRAAHEASRSVAASLRKDVSAP
jgi:hypothetical protein